MAKILSENAQKVLTYLQANKGSDLTAKDIAAALDMEARSVNGTLTGLQRKGLTVRVAQEEGDKLIGLTPAGAEFDPEAEKVEAE